MALHFGALSQRLVEARRWGEVRKSGMLFCKGGLNSFGFGGTNSRGEVLWVPLRNGRKLRKAWAFPWQIWAMSRSVMRRNSDKALRLLGG